MGNNQTVSRLVSECADGDAVLLLLAERSGMYSEASKATGVPPVIALSRGLPLRIGDCS